MTNFVSLSNLDSFQLQDIRVSAYQLAGNELANRGISDPDGELTLELANHLFEEAERWASFDEADQDDESYAVIFEEYFSNRQKEEQAKFTKQLIENLYPGGAPGPIEVPFRDISVSDFLSSLTN